jgi:hypothetical protein
MILYKRDMDLSKYVLNLEKNLYCDLLYPVLNSIASGIHLKVHLFLENKISLIVWTEVHINILESLKLEIFK